MPNCNMGRQVAQNVVSTELGEGQRKAKIRTYALRKRTYDAAPIGNHLSYE